MRAIAMVAALGSCVAACASDPSGVVEPVIATEPERTDPVATTIDASAGGWVGGEPRWSGGPDVSAAPVDGIPDGQAASTTTSTAPVSSSTSNVWTGWGSLGMGDEIDRLRTTIDTVADRISDLDPALDVRFAMTMYRDEGDSFLTPPMTSPAMSTSSRKLSIPPTRCS